MKLFVGSKNPAKIKAVKEVFSENYSIESCNAPSGVSNQPMTDEETKIGAVNRAITSAKTPGASAGIGLEGGVMRIGERLYICNWGALATEDGKVYTAGGARIPLPVSIEDMLTEGIELGDVIDKWTNRKGIRNREGAVGILTNGLITRDEMFIHINKMLRGQMLFEGKR